jgi:beta-glucuronidase
MPGIRSVTPQPWSEEYQADFLAMYHRVFDRIDAIVGEHVWAFSDFATSAGISRVDGNRKGVFTRDRRPKAAAFVLRRRWRREG